MRLPRSSSLFRTVLRSCNLSFFACSSRTSQSTKALAPLAVSVRVSSRALPLLSSCSSRPLCRQSSCIRSVSDHSEYSNALMAAQYFQRCFETGMRIRAGLVGVIYQKALVLSNDGRGRATGDIVNLMSVDATRLQDLSTYGLISISGPFQITLAFVSLYNLLGWAAFVGVAIMVVSIPLQTVIARFIKKLQEKQMKNRDQRTRLMSELLANIRRQGWYSFRTERRTHLSKQHQVVCMGERIHAMDLAGQK